MGVVGYACLMFLDMPIVNAVKGSRSMTVEANIRIGAQKNMYTKAKNKITVKRNQVNFSILLIK